MPHEILISDVIGGTLYGIDFGITAADVKRQLDEADDDEILVRINSPGGSVFEAAAIYNLLKDRNVDTQIDGLGASAASVIFQAGKMRTVAENAMLMIHNPSSIVVGESRDMRDEADLLDKVRDTIVDTYQTRSSLKRKELEQMMDAETWFTADEAVKAGLADSVDKQKNFVNFRFDLDKLGYKNKPADWPPPAPTFSRSDRLAQLEQQVAAMRA